MKTILLTGAAGGVGACLVQEYINRGYHVFGADIQENEKVNDQIREFQGKYEFKATDVSATPSVLALAQWVREKTDHLDIILNAAGVLYPKSERILQEFDVDGALPLFSINALGPLRIVQACIDLLRKGEDRLILNMSSQAGSVATHENYINRYDYCMSKSALNIQSVILQRYLKPEGIKVLLIHPGWVRTAMGGPNAPLLPAEAAQGVAHVADLHMHDLEGGMYFDYDNSPRPW